MPDIVTGSGNRFTRGRLLKVAAAGTGGAIATALITPALSLGPAFESTASTARRGTAVAGSSTTKAARTARDVSADTFYTAYPEGKSWDDVWRRSCSCGSTPRTSTCPRDARTGRRRESSRTRRHARTRPARSRCTASRSSTRCRREPALVCPCHYSTFDLRRAGRSLRPRRPSAAAAADHDRRKGELRAGGPSSRLRGRVVVGREDALEVEHVIRRGGPLRRLARVGRAAAQEVAALLVPGPLVVPAGRGRDVLRS